ncbi:LPO_1073/Vpar_1526 family protein [Pusillimonas sp. NJUB218]|uniref:LPO_1073/Vpar_1526 family protein n=1 Tax=Pusillimonas sp. NJUB218 TaxID=2023230 RepID=UPI000F4BB830|nr:LPO_1073/Vpar_1526 family protein [Pusillimonas sp. NJUB218]ROT44772.1 hypothetical protein CHR62_10055 [Pusillimonas sp. NJUB218]
MLNKNQDQTVASGGAAIQAAGDVTIVNTGISTAEARAIALDVAKATFYELSGLARDIASSRVEEITNRVIEKLEKENPSGLQKAKDPDFQYSLLTVQKEFARTGDTDLGDLLVDLLVDRSKQDQRTILQIVLNESLATAPKLTDGQLSALALIFLFRYTQNYQVGNHKLFGEYLDKHVFPHSARLPKSAASYQHLEFAGCGTALVGGPLEETLGKRYGGLFLKGFEKAELTSRGISVGLDSRFVIPCLTDPSKLQNNAMNRQTIEKQIEEKQLSADDGAKLLTLFDESKLNDIQVKEKVIQIRPFMKEVFDAWVNTPMQSFTLTSVGIAIGHANIKRFAREFTELEVWIN